MSRRRPALWALLLLGLAFRGAWGPPPSGVLSGRSMGSTWTVRLDRPPEPGLFAAIQGRLDGIDARFSTWRPDSELMRFNARRDVGWVPVSAEFLEVVEAALQIREATKGAFDPAVFPLVRAWGFGPFRARRLPSEEELGRLRRVLGEGRLERRGDPPALRKTHPDLELDLSGIVEGFAADAVGALLEGAGHADTLVEIGGELRVRGRARRVALESPSGGRPARLGPLSLGVATSGTYRNYRSAPSGSVSHILDPRTGRPAASGVISATAVHASAATADAWATALLVLGPEGLALAEAAGIPARLLFQSGEERQTPAFVGLRSE